MLTGKQTRLRFAVATSQDPDAEAAGLAIARAARGDLRERTADLAFLFFSSHYASNASELCEAVRRELAPAVLVGCTGEGIIAGSEELESAAAVTLWAAHLPGTHLTPVRLSGAQADEGFSMDGWPEELGIGSTNRPTFILLADPFSTPANEMLAEIAERCPGSAAIGGLAGGGRDQGENRLVLNGEVYDEGLVGVALSGPLSVRTIVSQGCRPIGDPYVVTRAEHNIIYELGGSTALERLQTVFESLPDDQRRIAHQALHLGIVIDEHRARFERGDFLVRNLIGADRTSGSVAIGDRVQEGQTVQFHLRDAQAASEDLNLLLAADRSRHPNPPLGALLFSCCGRGQGLFGRPHHDITTVRERMGGMPVAGFFAQGEIGPVGGSNFVHGYTASLALFSEPDS
jgi:small ligand-binding sensory domain FIST